MYVGFFFEGDVGPIGVPNYWTHNYAGYYSDIHTAYIHNPVDIGSTPVGFTVVHAPRLLDSLRFSFRWWPGPQSPPNDIAKYTMLSSGIIQPDEFPSLSDTRCLISFGAFTLYPVGSPSHDTLTVAIGIVCGQSLSNLRLRAMRARAIYENGGVVKVDEHDGQGPAEFQLLQNYPNPFNPSTKIRFALAQQSQVRLSVFDMLGREVAVLVNGEMSAGMHSVEWNAQGRASGVYICRLSVGSRTETRKLVVLR
jgi:hypothetical protein